MGKKQVDSLQPAGASWRGLLLYCGKCAGKQGLGKALRSDLKRALKEAGHGKRIRVAETTCLDVCPKHGTTLCAVTAGGGRLAVLPEGEAPDAALALLAD